MSNATEAEAIEIEKTREVERKLEEERNFEKIRIQKQQEAEQTEKQEKTEESIEPSPANDRNYINDQFVSVPMGLFLNLIDSSVDLLSIATSEQEKKAIEIDLAQCKKIIEVEQ